MKKILQTALGIVLGVVLLIVILPLLGLIGNLLLFAFLKLGSLFLG
ncbi:MAG: hypothetical protein NC200_01625 [Candidatus Gastranaerophilales bacterium]|nr:hypothetical protein [Candidatus Gastranaerophilales bacterium]